MDFMRPIVIERLEAAIAKASGGALVASTSWVARNDATINVRRPGDGEPLFGVVVGFDAEAFSVSLFGEAALRAAGEAGEPGEDRLAEVVATLEAAARNALSEAAA